MSEQHEDAADSFSTDDKDTDAIYTGDSTLSIGMSAGTELQLHEDLEQGALVGEYLLQEHLGHLGWKGYHTSDPAFSQPGFDRIFTPFTAPLEKGSQSSLQPYEISLCCEKTALQQSPISTPTLEMPHTKISSKLTPQEQPVCLDLSQAHCLPMPAQLETKQSSTSTQTEEEGDQIWEAGPNQKYFLKKKFDSGSHGEVWRAFKMSSDGRPISNESYVLKRMRLEHGNDVLQCGLREVYFGKLLHEVANGVQGEPGYVARFVEHFFMTNGQRTDGFASEFTNSNNGKKRARPPKKKMFMERTSTVVEHYQRLSYNETNGSKPGQETSKVIPDLWLVFRDEGVSLSHVLYSDLHLPQNQAILHRPSLFWHSMRKDSNGTEVFKRILLKIFKGVEVLHRQNIVHRDLKPSNILISLPHIEDTEDSPQATTYMDQTSQFCSHETQTDAPSQRKLTWQQHKHHWGKRQDNGVFQSEPEQPSSAKQLKASVRLADFSSAVSADVLAAGLYGPQGPTQKEATREYMPPECLFDQEVPYFEAKPESFDMWSLGVIFLEMLLGTPEVFTVDQRTRAVLAHHLRNEEESVRQKAYLLAALADFCIYSSDIIHWPLGDQSMVGGTCTLTDMAKALQVRDPLDKGLQDKWGLHLLRELLRWDPMQRISIQDALSHAFFKGPYKSKLDGSEHATLKELAEYEKYTAEVAGRSRNKDALVLSQSTHTQLQHPVPKTFGCPKCGRIFQDWESCNSHIKGRKHGRFCSYDTSSLPPCITGHSMLPFDPQSGWCDVQGRRAKLEDYHSIVFSEDYKFYGVFDGHWGTKVAKFVSRALHSNLELFLDHEVLHESTKQQRKRRRADPNEELRQAVLKAFRKTEEDVQKITTEDEMSGATATIAMVYSNQVLVANVGDSKAVMCCDLSGNAVDVTKDHVPKYQEERARVEAMGGFIEHKGVLRVNGQLAVTRSFGDRPLKKYISSVPDIYFLNKKDWPKLKFLIVASDGLWDMMTSEDAVQMVTNVIESSANLESAFQEAATSLTYEAYVRGSSDNIGVCVIDLEHVDINNV